MIEAYKKFWKNFSNFNGRSTRSDYWLALLGNIIVAFVLGFVLGFISGALDMPALIMLGYVYSLAMIVPSIAIVIRRLHDINKSGWYYFVVFIPLVGSIIALIFLCTPSVNENNQYGERV